MTRRIKKDYSKLSQEELIAEIQKLLEEKKYGLMWENKEEDVVKQCQKELPVLEEVKNKEILTDQSNPINLLIEGDNYHALSVLNYTHAKKVDVIYIDPPYNTGNKDFIFNDHYVDKEDTYRHSKWLSFMEKRLKLAKNLLKDDGVIFISIDDNEVAQLKLLCDEIFGENNFIAKVVWRKKYGGGKGARFFVDLHEYVLCYTRNISKINGFSIARSEKKKEIFNLKDDYFEERGKYYIRPLKSGLAYRKNLIYPIKCPNGTEITTQWICGKDTFEQLLKQGRIIFKKLKNGKYNVYKKFYEKDQLGKILPESIIYDLAYNQNGKEEIKDIFRIKEGREVVFENAKPTKLIKYLITLVPHNTNAIVLDFFVGSGTTGHAVLELNKEDNGNRRFILCTNNENKICTDVCYPRIKKVIKGYKNLKGKKVDGLGGNLKYYKTSFVPKSRVSDDTKYNLVQRSTEMICIKEDTFEKVIDKKYIKIFKNTNQYTAILFHLDYFNEFKKELRGLDKQIHIYVFSLTSDTYDEDFKDLKQKYDLCPIPESILEVYKRVFEK
jgi:adenine-specific DNA-methyltransferase